MNSLFVSLVQSDVLHQKRGKNQCFNKFCRIFLLRAEELKYEKLLPFLVNRGDLLSSGTASEAFSFYNPLKWALLFSRNRSNSGVKKKRKRVGAWPSQLQYFVCLTLLLHLHTVPNIHFLSNKSTWGKPCILYYDRKTFEFSAEY